MKKELKKTILGNFTIGGKIYLLEDRGANLFVIRCNDKTLSMHTTKEKGLQAFSELQESLKGGEKQMSEPKGIEQARAVADKLKAEQAEKEEKALEMQEKVKNELAAIRSNPELAKMYSENAQVGAANLASELPVLKVHATGKSTKNILEDGSEPSDGAFFYKPTKEEFVDPVCHILTISKGFRAAGMPDKDGKTELVFNQVLGGVIVHEGDYKPFIFYFSGTKLQNLWNFGKEASRYTKQKPVSIPMFALLVKLSTEKQKTSFGNNWVVNFEILKNEDGSPKLVLDPGEFQFLKDNVETIEDTIKSLITMKTTQVVSEVEPERLPVSQEEEIIEAGEVQEGEDVNPDEISF